MKQLLCLLLMLTGITLFAQQHPVTNITIALGQNPDANTVNWASGTTMLSISATAKMVNGRVDPSLEGSRILVTVKRGSSVICGSYNSNTAPQANFNTISKVWNGNAAVSLLGQDCTLPAGNYELCVRFFGGPANMPLSEEKCKTFSVRGKETITYQLPQLILPANNSVVKQRDLKNAFTFRWTPLQPKSNEKVIYKLRLWQTNTNQPFDQVIKSNAPTVEKEIENATMFALTGTAFDVCPPYCDYLWNIQTTDKDGKPIGPNNGVSETWRFVAEAEKNSQPKISLQSPANNSAVDTKASLVFKWKLENTSAQQPAACKIKIVEIKGDESPIQALKGNKPFFEKDSIKAIWGGNKPIFEKDSAEFFEIDFSKAPFNSLTFTSGKKYAWQVTMRQKDANGRDGKEMESEVWVYTTSPCNVSLSLQVKSVECVRKDKLNTVQKVCVEITYSSNQQYLTFNDAGSGFKAYDSNATINYVISNPTTSLNAFPQVFGTTTVPYCFEVTVPNNVNSFQLGLQGDDKMPGPITCQPGAQTTINTKECPNNSCDCGKWGVLIVGTGDGEYPYSCDGTIIKSCNKPFAFSTQYQCLPNTSNCITTGKWQLSKGTAILYSDTGFIGTLPQISNGTYKLTFFSECNGKKCTPCSYTIVVRDCGEEAKCDCGTWGNLLVKVAAGPKPNIYPCRSEIKIPCKKPFNFSNSFQCNPNEKQCEAKVTWDITLNGAAVTAGSGSNGSFTPTQNGVYTLTYNASCNGKECEPCVYKIVVTDCIEEAKCDCGKWGNLLVKVAAGPKPNRYPCRSEIKISCKKPFNFSNSFQCNPNEKQCEAKISWDITLNGAAVTEGSGSNGSFTPTQNGVYTLTYNASCNGKECEPCVYKIVVRDCGEEAKCDCGTWGNLLVKVAAGPKPNRYPCRSEIKIPCKKVFNFSNSFQCNPNEKQCEAKVTWDITLNGAAVTAGSGSNGSFTPTQNGVYTLTYNASCNGKECEPCVYTIVVSECIEEAKCDCGRWGDLNVQHATGISKEVCGKEIPWNCNKPFKFTNSYNCNPNSKACEAKTSWNIKKDGVLIKTATGTISDGFTPTSNGIYTLTLYAQCGGKTCDSCTYKIIVRDCVPPTCSCGSWGKLSIENSPISNLSCGAQINWNCNKPLKFSNSLSCNPANKDCEAKTYWSVSLGGTAVANGSGGVGSFTPTQNGVYTITLNGECGGKKCDSCTYKVVVRDCVPPTCNCGSWGKLSIENSPVSNLSCGAQMPWKCNKLFSFSNSLVCNPNNKDCLAKANWSVSLSGTTIANGFGATGSFMPTQNGTYTIRLNGECGNNKCDSCVYNIIVSDCTTPSCFSFDNIGSIICLGPNDSGGYNYQFALTINNQTGSELPSAVLSFSCKSSFVLSESTISQGIKTYTMTLSTHNSSITACCIKYNGYCISEKCFDLPTCN